MGDRLRIGIPPLYVTSHPGKLSLLPSAKWQMSTGQNWLMLCGSGVKAYRHTGWAKKVIPLVQCNICTRGITFLAHPVHTLRIYKALEIIKQIWSRYGLFHSWIDVWVAGKTVPYKYLNLMTVHTNLALLR